MENKMQQTASSFSICLDISVGELLEMETGVR